MMSPAIEAFHSGQLQTSSFLVIARRIHSPHTPLPPSGKRRMRSGIAISALQPCASRRVSASQIPSHCRSRSTPVRMPSSCTPNGFTPNT